MGDVWFSQGTWGVLHCMFCGSPDGVVMPLLLWDMMYCGVSGADGVSQIWLLPEEGM